MKIKVFLLIITSIITFTNQKTKAMDTDSTKLKSKLVVIWTSGDPNVAEKVAFMYTHAAKKNQWFDEVTLIIWGPSAKLITENIELQKKVKAMQADGIKTEACLACANSYGLADNLKELGFDVKSMGVPLTEYLKSDAKVLTF
jgi:hypothetical protein